ncbi:MAG: hypothetical protein H0X43_11845 [Nitrosospira sp.]|nr:hypothetical protein [Nitrosospira sp.]
MPSPFVNVEEHTLKTNAGLTADSHRLVRREYQMAAAGMKPKRVSVLIQKVLAPDRERLNSRVFPSVFKARVRRAGD